MESPLGVGLKVGKGNHLCWSENCRFGGGDKEPVPSGAKRDGVLSSTSFGKGPT